MVNLYLGTMLIAPFALAIVQFIFGADEKLENEKEKALASFLVYTSQMLISILALFMIDFPNTIHFEFVHLEGYHYVLSFVLTKGCVFLAAVFSLIFMLVERMSYTYLHAEEEHTRFYGLKALFNFATIGFLFSSNIDFLFFNWEIVGISSALLISYFYRRNQTLEHSMFAFSIYRLCDAAFLLLALVLFHFYKTESIEQVGAGTPAFIMGLLAFLAIMGKSGIYPFSSWLPLAMEGPTPSTNLYYMAISTHLGAVFLIKTQSLWSVSLGVKGIIIAACALNFLLCVICAKVQTNIKGSLAYSSMAQVSLIIIEVALGFGEIAYLHIAFHALYRTAQMSFAPSIIDKINLAEKLSHGKLPVKEVMPSLVYFMALSGFRAEEFLKRFRNMFFAPFKFAIYLELALLGNRTITEEDREPVALQGGGK